MANYLISNEEYLAHHGIKGQKWGVRRYRNEDGSLTEAGKKRVQRAGKRLDRVQKSALRAGDKAAKRTEKSRRYDRRPLFLKNEVRLATKHNKAVKAGEKAERRMKKAAAMYKRLSNKYSSLGIDGLSQEQIQRGQEIADRMRAYEHSYATGRIY